MCGHAWNCSGWLKYPDAGVYSIGGDCPTATIGCAGGICAGARTGGMSGSTAGGRLGAAMATQCFVTLLTLTSSAALLFLTWCIQRPNIPLMQLLTLLALPAKVGLFTDCCAS